MDENQIQNHGAGDNAVKIEQLQKADEAEQDQSSMGEVIAGVDLQKRKFQLGPLFGNHCADYAEGSALDNWLKKRVQRGDNYVCSHFDPISFVSEFFTTNAVNTRIPGPIYEPPEMRAKNSNQNTNDASQVEEFYQQPILRLHINSSDTRMPMTPILQQSNRAYQHVVPVKVETNADETPNDLLNETDITDSQLEFTSPKVIDLSSSQELIDVANISQQTFSESLDADKEQLAIENSIDVNDLSHVDQPITFEHLNVSMKESDTDQPITDVLKNDNVEVHEPKFDQLNGDLQIAEANFDQSIQHLDEDLQALDEEVDIEHPVKDLQAFNEEVDIEHPVKDLQPSEELDIEDPSEDVQAFNEEVDTEHPVKDLQPSEELVIQPIEKLVDDSQVNVDQSIQNSNEDLQVSEEFVSQPVEQPVKDLQALDKKVDIEHPVDILQSFERDVEQQAEVIPEIDVKPPIEVLQTPKIFVKRGEINKQFSSLISKLKEGLEESSFSYKANIDDEQTFSSKSAKHIAAKELVEKSSESGFVLPNLSSISKAMLLTICSAIFDQSQFAFRAPVDTKKVENYLEIIKEPMDLGTIKKMIKSGEITTLEDFYAKCMLVVNNATTFTPDSSKPIHRDALKLKKICQDQIDITLRPTTTRSRKSVSRFGFLSENEGPSKKRSRRSSSRLV